MSLLPASQPGIRPVKSVTAATPTMEGAGVHLKRAFGFHQPDMLDPFLLFDDFGSDDPAKYRAGFPWHPHRGIETITYVLEGSVEHRDSLGNRGRLGAGAVQWMTAGSGILHQEMPEGTAAGRMHGFQLWANLPAADKMCAPRYQDIAASDIARVTEDDGTHIRIITGAFAGQTGPVDGIATDPLYLDITLPPGLFRRFRVDTYRRTFAYIFEGSGKFVDAAPPRGVLVEKELAGHEVHLRDLTGARSLVTFDTGDEVAVQAGPDGMRFLLIAGAPLNEPIAWHGPIVMNTRAELRTAFRELQTGNFIKAAR